MGDVIGMSGMGCWYWVRTVGCIGIGRVMAFLGGNIGLVGWGWSVYS